MEQEIAYFFPETPERKLAGNLDLELLVCGYAEEKSNLETLHPFRTDPFFRLYFPLHGKIRVSGCNGATVIKPGQSYMFPANVPFRFLSLGGFTHNWVHFSSRMLSRLPQFQKLRTVPTHPEDAGLWQEFLQLASCQDTLAGAVRANLLLRRLLLPFLENAESDDLLRPLELERFQVALDFAAQHLAEPLSTPRLAALCNLNRNEFSRAFRHAFGIPPKQYLTRLRMERAKELLLTTDETIKEIARHCGYDNEYFFYRIFKKHVKLTPSIYRSTIDLG